MTSPFDAGLDRNASNYAALSPLSFIARSALAYPDRTSVIHGDVRHTWRQTYERCRRLASALSRRGIGKNDTVAVMASNIPAMVEVRFGVAMCGAVLNTLNTRLDGALIGFMLSHGEAKVLLTDCEFSSTVSKAWEGLERDALVIDIADALAPGGELIGSM